MRADLRELVTRQVKAGAAVPAFTCYGADTALAVVAAAEALRLPVVLLVAPSSATAASGPKLIATLRHIADDSAVPVCVQLDHAKDEAVIRRGIDAGADAVLADGSHLPPEDNAAFVRGSGNSPDPPEWWWKRSSEACPGPKTKPAPTAPTWRGKPIRRRSARS